MKRFMISFNDGDMKFDRSELPQVAEDAHRVLREAKAAGVWNFGGGFLYENKPVVVAESGAVTDGPLARSEVSLGGFTIVEVATETEAYDWAAKIAKACRCAQEVREMIWDPESTN